MNEEEEDEKREPRDKDAYTHMQYFFKAPCDATRNIPSLRRYHVESTLF